MKVLIAEDESVSGRLLQRSLESWGHEVAVAHDGMEAWDRFQQDDFSVVISDWIMPGLDGPELIRRIRSHPTSGYVYVILLTGKSETEDLVQGIEAGADDFVTKPFDQDELRARLRAGERIVRLEQDLARNNVRLEALNRGLTAANQRMQRDLDAAARVQRTLLPTTPPDVAAIRCAWLFRPCVELAGDLLNVFRLDDDHVALYVLDASGHGVASALLAVAVSRFLSPASDPSSLLVRPAAGSSHVRLASPAEVADQLNRRFPWDPATEQYFTLVYGVLDLRTTRFDFASAGHPGLLHLPRQGPATFLDAPGLPIGIGSEAYQDHSLRLEPGDRLFLYSDGIPEAMDAGHRIFGREGLLNAVEASRGLPLEEGIAAIERALAEFCAGTPFRDDVSLLALEVVGS